MTNRPGRDWTPLGYWADPVPGDGSEVQAFADIFRKTETSLVSARDALRPVTNGDMIGVRADNIRTEASAVESKLGLVQTRYAAAASALQTYGDELVDFQRRSLQILDSAAGPARDLQSAQGDARWRYAQLLVMLPGPERDEKIMDYNRVRARSDALKSEVDQAKAELHRIIEERDNAASTAAATIRSAVDHSGLNDTPWDMAKEFAAEALDFLDRNASTIGDVLDRISLGVLAISPLFGLAAPVVALISRVIAAVGAGFSVYGAFREASRTGDWGKFAVTTAVAIVSIIPMGKVAGKTLSGVAGKSAEKVAVRSRSLSQFMSTVGKGKKLSVINKLALTDTFIQTKKAQLVKAVVRGNRDVSYRWVSTALKVVNGLEEKAVEGCINRFTTWLPRYPPIIIQGTHCPPMAVPA